MSPYYASLNRLNVRLGAAGIFMKPPETNKKTLEKLEKEFI